jgi:hypothetical protein
MTTRISLVVAVQLLLQVASIAVQTPAGLEPVAIGLDHVPIAVRDLEGAAATYRKLGFSLKPGRPHANGIRNQHVKFPDGTELELITAPAARDALTTTYRRHLRLGDGPAFLALFTPDTARAPRDLAPSLSYLFFGARNASPTDRPEHFAHANSAASLVSVWLAADDLREERALFTRLGATISTADVDVPDRTTAEVATFREGDIRLLPASHQRVKGRKIVGVTVRVGSIEKVRGALRLSGIPTASNAAPSTSLFVAPDRAQGLWLEFRSQ